MTDDGGLPLVFGLPVFAFLLLANAIFVATEFALITVRRGRIDQLATEGNVSARRVQSALGNLDYYIAAAQLGITMASILLGTFGEPVIASVIEPPIIDLFGFFGPAIAHTIAIAIAFTLVTALHIILGEFVPKTIALEEAEKTSLAIAYPLSIFVRIFGPIITALNATGNGLLRLLGMDLKPLGDEPLTAKDLASTFETSASAGLISRREFSLTRHLLRLSDITSRELMVPRSQVVAISEGASWDRVTATFAERPLTRYPVYEGSIDHIVGVLDAKRLLLAGDAETSTSWTSQMQPIAVMPELVTADIALDTMRKQESPMVVLVDEYGGTAGLITQFDIVRFLTADTPDNPHDAEHLVHVEDRTSPQILSGRVPVSELVETLDIDLDDVEAVTVGGLITEHIGRIPSVGDVVRSHGLILEVLEMDDYRVAQIQMQRDDRPDNPIDDGDQEKQSR